VERQPDGSRGPLAPDRLGLARDVLVERATVVVGERADWGCLAEVHAGILKQKTLDTRLGAEFSKTRHDTF
jgi:hypothetical protein